MERNIAIEHQGHQGARRVMRNALLLLSSRAIGIVFTLVIFSLSARYLAPELFGIFAFITAVSMTVRPLVDFGFENIICREIARDQDTAPTLVSTTLVVRSVLSLIMLAGAAALTYSVTAWDSDAKYAMVLSILSELCMSMGATYLAVMRAYERMEWELIVHFIFRALSTVLLILVIYYDLGFVNLFYARLAPSVVFLLLSAWILYRKFVPLSFAYDAARAKFIFRESYPVAMFTILLALIFRVDVFILQWLKSAFDVAIFEVPNRLIGQVQIFAVSISLSFFPALARSAEGDPGGALTWYYRNAYRVLFLAGMAFMGLLFSGGAPLIRLLAGEGYLDAVVTLRLLSPTVLVLFLAALQNMLMTAAGKQQLNVYTIIIALVINTVLDLLLVPHYAAVGAGIATLVSNCALLLLNEYMIAKIGVRLQLGTFSVRTAAAAAAMCISLLINLHNDVLTLVIRWSAGGALYIACLFAFKAVTWTDVQSMRENFLGKRRRPAWSPGAQER